MCLRPVWKGIVFLTIENSFATVEVRFCSEDKNQAAFYRDFKNGSGGTTANIYGQVSPR